MRLSSFWKCSRKTIIFENWCSWNKSFDWCLISQLFQRGLILKHHLFNLSIDFTDSSRFILISWSRSYQFWTFCLLSMLKFASVSTFCFFVRIVKSQSSFSVILLYFFIFFIICSNILQISKISSFSERRCCCHVSNSSNTLIIFFSITVNCRIFSSHCSLSVVILLF